MQPLLYIDCPDFQETLRTKLGLDVALQVVAGRFNGRKSLPFRDKLMLSIVGDELGDRFRCSLL
jgi:hypothetical protein